MMRCVDGGLDEVFEEFYRSGVVNEITNETYICLIPKITDAWKFGKVLHQACTRLS